MSELVEIFPGQKLPEGMGKFSFVDNIMYLAYDSIVIRLDKKPWTAQDTENISKTRWFLFPKDTYDPFLKGPLSAMIFSLGLTAIGC